MSSAARTANVLANTVRLLEPDESSHPITQQTTIEALKSANAAVLTVRETVDHKPELPVEPEKKWIRCRLHVRIRQCADKR